MVRFTAEEYADMVQIYGVAGGNGAEAVRVYAERFPHRRVPNARTFRNAVQRLREGNVLPRQGGDGRPVGRGRRQLEEAILDCVEETPELSIRGIAGALNSTPSMVHRVLKDEGFHPFKYTPVQELKPEDYPKRVEYCRWILDQARDPHFLSNVCWSDEKLFVRKGIVNQHNEHHWAVENPRLTRESKFQYRWNAMNIWGAIIGNAVHIYQLHGHLTGESYLEFLRTNLGDVVGVGPGDRDVWFQHDGAPAHTCVAVVEQLNDWFPDRWIGNRNDRDRRGIRHPPVAWPPRSPDLTPLDFYLWGNLEAKVYQHHPQNQEEMVALLHAAVASITPDELQRVRDSILKRARLCIEVEGGHFQNLL